MSLIGSQRGVKSLFMFFITLCVSGYTSVCVPDRSRGAGPSRLGRSNGVYPLRVHGNRGTAGRKRRQLIEERACNEKTFNAKVKYLNVLALPAPFAVLVVPTHNEAVMPSSDKDFEV
jgi:hypothetical protein